MVQLKVLFLLTVELYNLQMPEYSQSFNLNYFLKGSISKYSHIGGYDFNM